METASTFRLKMSLRDAVRRLRKGLEGEELQVAFEFEMSICLRRELQVELCPAVLLGVHSPVLLLESMVADGRAGLFLPLHVLLTGKGKETLVRVLRPECCMEAGVPIGVLTPLLRTIRRVESAVAGSGASRVVESRPELTAIEETSA
ncbi:MAG: DUF302 domain-containing protein [Bryobacterales bacterium]|nr:DUF302 domain-containing protein [Bryobacterales bacterium]